MSDLVVVENLVKHFPVRRGVVPRTVGHIKAVDGVSFTIRRGETLALVGESGCGKTTLGRAVLRLIEPTSGSVVFDGQDILRLSPPKLRSLRRRMQIIFQDPFGSLNPRMTLGGMLAEPMLVHGIAESSSGTSNDSARPLRSRVKERVAELLDLVGLAPEYAGRYPHEFSGGQRQRIGIARALALSPEFIVCDEAVSALDVSIQAQILNLLSDLQARFNLTYLFIAHDLAVVRHISDHVAVMYLGEIVETAQTEELFAHPLHPYTRALLEAVPVPNPKVKPMRARDAADLPSPSEPPSGCRFRTRCPLAIEQCAETRPALEEIRSGHLVACIRAGEPGHDAEDQRKPVTLP